MRKVDPARYEEKRREILAAAETCLVRKGFGRTSIADICAAAEISPGHLYHYFESKEDIVAAIAELRLEAASEATGRILDAADPFAAFLDHLCRPKPGSSPLLLELLAEASRDAAIASVMRTHSAGIRDLFAEILRRGQLDGKVDPALDLDLAACLLVGLVDGMKALAVRQPRLGRARLADMVETLVTRFLAAPRSVHGRGTDR